jgi:hypothetical protein
MKTITANAGKTCKPPCIPETEKMTTDQVQSAYDEIADRYEKRFGSINTFSAWLA